MNQPSVTKVYVDGQAGTTALQVADLLKKRSDIKLIRLPDADRKVASARREAIGESDVTILCLPDEAARQAVEWARESGTRVIDTSTAHRVAHHWNFGMPELSPTSRQALRSANTVANPGCYPTGVILLLRPLLEEAVLAPDCRLSIHALSGYSGGGRSLIETWENPDNPLLAIPFSTPYALDRRHKHIPEIMKYSGLQCEPQFLPRVGPFFKGMRVEIPLHAGWLEDAGANRIDNIFTALEVRYRNEPFVRLRQLRSETIDQYTFDPRRCNDTNRIELTVCDHPSGHTLLVAILDNLGKGASGAAVQCMNLMIGVDEGRGLHV